MPFDRRQSSSSARYAGVTAIAAALALFAPPRAAGTTAVLGISAAVAANCTISTGALSFGSYEALLANATTALNATGTMRIACTKGSAPRITMDLGQNPNGGKRYMTLVGSGSAGLAGALYYEIYQPPDPTPGAGCSFPGSKLWGASATQAFVPSAPTGRAARSYSVCGTIPPGQFTVLGTYADTVVATVNF
jgi:spore coat protein U domain-containing protein, fimbrial subunit CupE1/2/3/6